MSEQKKKKFEVRIVNRYVNPPRKAIFIDDEMFDWEIDPTSLEEAGRMGPEYYAAAKRDIEKHFLDSLSEFMGRKITIIEFANAAMTGWI